MNQGQQPARKTVYVSRSPWPAAIDHVLVVYCSDPWYREATVEFLGSLRINQYDQVVMPGGPAMILQSSLTFVNDRARVKLLYEEHGIRRIIGIAHFNCAYYRRRHGQLDAEVLRKKQEADLAEFEKEVKKIASEAYVELYYTEARGQNVEFVRL